MNFFQIIIDVTEEEFDDDTTFNQSDWTNFMTNDYINVFLVDIETEKILLSGDEYHDKIFSKIEGFLEGIKYGFGSISVIKSIRNGNKIFDIEG